MSLISKFVRFYNLEETSGTVVTDATGNADASVNLERVFTSEISGIVGTCADFTQGADFITTNYTTPNTFSISMWLNIQAWGTNDTRVAEEFGTGADGRLFIAKNGAGSNKLLFRVFDTVSRDCLSSDLSFDTWYHFVWVVEQGVGCKLYENNILVDSVGVWNGFSVIRPLRFALGRANNHPFNGYMDAIGIANDVLTIDDTNNLYNSSAGLQYPFSASSGGIAKINGIPIANIAKINGVAKANVAKVSGVDL